MKCLHISAPIVSNDLVTARQPCNLLSHLSTCMDVEHSLHVQTCTHTYCMLRQLWPCMRCHMHLTQTVVLCRCVYGVQLAGHMNQLCLPNCTYSTITTAAIHRFSTLLYSLAFMLWCSCAMPRMCSLY